MELYTPVLALTALAAGFAIVSLIMSALIGPKRYNRAKLDAYECGIEPTPPGWKCASTSCQLMPEPLIVAEVAR